MELHSSSNIRLKSHFEPFFFVFRRKMFFRLSFFLIISTFVRTSDCRTKIGHFQTKSNGVKGTVYVLNDKQILLQQFTFLGKTYFTKNAFKLASHPSNACVVIIFFTSKKHFKEGETSSFTSEQSRVRIPALKVALYYLTHIRTEMRNTLLFKILFWNFRRI